MSVNTPTRASLAAPPRPPMPEVQKPGLHLDYLDGLRGFAALWVVCGHAFLFECGWDAVLGRHGLALNWLHYLRFAVDIFIVLSGYCLAIPVVRADGALRGGAVAFFKKRVRRILPPYFAALALALAFDALAAWMHHDHFHVMKRELAVGLLLLQDCRPDLNHIDSPMWSVALEWKIYFLFPLVVFLLRRFGKVGMLLGTAAIGYGVARVTPHLGICPDAWFVFLFGMGVCGSAVAFGKSAADCVRPTVAVLLASLAGLALLVHRYPAHDLPSYITSAHHFWITDTVVGAVTASALVLLNRGSRAGGLLALPQRALSWRPLVCLGTFSYSLYLVHNPMQLPLHYLLNSPHLDHLNPMQRFAALSVGGTALCIGAAYLFHLAFEKPFMTLRRADALGVTAQGGVFRLRPAPVGPAGGSGTAQGDRQGGEAEALPPAPPEDKARGRVHLDYLDGLRGLAALFVVFCHTSPTENGHGGGYPHWFYTLLTPTGYGHSAVAVFIVLSGFVLMLPVARSADGRLRGGLEDYLKRRAWRILPPYYAALVLCILLIKLVPAMHQPTANIWRVSLPVNRLTVAEHVFMLHNLDPSAALTIDGTMWSVATEWQIYFVFGLLLLPLCRRYGLAATVAAAFALGLTPHYLLPPAANYDWAAPWYLGLFSLGMAGASLAYGRRPWSPFCRMPWGVLSASFALVFVLAARHKYSWVEGAAHLWMADTLVGLVTVCLILYCARSLSGRPPQAAPVVVRLLSARPVVQLGAFSYSLYLVHFPVIEVGHRLLRHLHLSPALFAVCLYGAVVPAAVLAGYGFHLAFEKPFMARRRKEAPATEAPAEAALSPAP